MLEQFRQGVEEARRVWVLDFKQALDLVVKAQADKTLNNNNNKMQDKRILGTIERTLLQKKYLRPIKETSIQLYLPIEIQKMLEGTGRIRIQLL
jgi:hypothetical protein